jgi:hypothetical protein
MAKSAGHNSLSNDGADPSIALMSEGKRPGGPFGLPIKLFSPVLRAEG